MSSGVAGLIDTETSGRCFVVATRHLRAAARLAGLAQPRRARIIVSTMAHDVVVVLDAPGVGAAHVIGLSMRERWLPWQRPLRATTVGSRPSTRERRLSTVSVGRGHSFSRRAGAGCAWVDVSSNRPR